MIKYALSFFLLIVVIQTQAQVGSFLESGNEKLSKRNFEGAIQDYNRFLINQPNNIDALCGRAEAKIDLGNYQEAKKDVEQALKLTPDNGRALTLKGDVLFNMKDYTKALQAYNEASRSKDKPDKAIVGKAKVMDQQGNSKEAYRILDEVILHQPQNPEFYYARGLLNNSTGKYARALLDFEKVISLNANFNSFGINFNRGISFLNLSLLDNAIEAFNKAIGFDPQSATAYHSRGLANYQMENYKESIDDFIKSDELNPNNPVTYYNLGMTYLKMNDKGNACFYFHKSCRLNNTNACKMIVLECSDNSPKR
ncbi:MAG: tetratricopeptide repeat protein [Bacteroidota bacterium]|nr:tetratricopeptide repeat protein [Bacteroidota bacterium]